jgi:Domain of unknown function (DUF4412)
MRILIAATRFAAPLALTALCSLPAAAQFEGTITWQMGERGMVMNQTYKGNMVRTDMTGPRGSGVVLMDASAKTMTMLMSERKMFMTMNLDEMAKMDGMEHSEPQPPKITDTGKSETIADRTCEVYRVETAGERPETLEVCAAKGMGFFIGGQNPMGRRQGEGAAMRAIAANPEFAKLYKEGFFPLRVARVENGQPKTIMLATKVEPKSVEASAFQVPSDYTEMKMPAGMGMPRQ